MPYKLITEYNMSAGLHMLPVYLNDVSHGLFMRLVITSIWILCVFGSYFLQKKVNNNVADFPTSIAVGGFVTIILSTILKLIPGLVDNLTYAVVIIIGAISILWFLFTKNN